MPRRSQELQLLEAAMPLKTIQGACSICSKAHADYALRYSDTTKRRNTPQCKYTKARVRGYM